MVRRPVSAVALFMGLVLYVLTSLCPEIFIPSCDVSFNQITEAQGRVCGIENKKTNTYVFLEHVSIGGQSSGKTVVMMPSESAATLKLGNPVKIRGRREEFSEARNKGNFDEKSYYRSLGYFNKFNAENVTVTGSGFYPVGEAMRQLKIRITEAIDRIIVENGFTETNISGVFKAVVTGDKSGLDEDTKDLYQRNGIAHILAVSGLHISTLGLILFKFLRKYFSVVISASVSGLVMTLFAVMCGGSVSAVRASVMFVIMMGGYIFRRRYDMLTALGAAGIMLLLANPFYIQNQGFVLSFSAIMGIGLLAGPVNEFLSVKSKILSAFIASASVTLFTLPWIISSYYEIPLYSILLNMLVVPLMSSVLGCGLFSG
ncbi:MAG: ComEC/Rec2 family competence protein, partial [Parasporobacterium sp.]|nr:ComEC/Rec2 family competence protein [Parasporobacterium sp.]